MTTTIRTILLLLLLPFSFSAQENPLDIFKPLVDHTWYAEGHWGDGSKFRQEVDFEFSLNDKIVTVESQGFINQEQTRFGARNHGIRQYDQDSETIRFWEFDVFGGLTEGTVEADGKNLIYTYDYGGTFLTEMWIYEDEETYRFIVGTYEQGQWTQKFLETRFTKKPE